GPQPIVERPPVDASAGYVNLVGSFPNLFFAYRAFCSFAHSRISPGSIAAMLLLVETHLNQSNDFVASRLLITSPVTNLWQAIRATPASVFSEILCRRQFRK